MPSITDSIETAAPLFRDMTTPEIQVLLSRNSVGRIAFSFHDIVDIRPLHYTYANNWLFGRTSPSDKLMTLRHNQWVAFEVDEVAGLVDWESVVIRGTFYRLRSDGSVHDRRLYKTGLRAIRKVMPDAFTGRDRVSFRTEMFGIAIDSMTGRSCSTITND